MCRPVPCRRCGNTTWAGCGQHVDQVMSGVPKPDRCTCATDDPPVKRSLRDRLTGRNRS